MDEDDSVVTRERERERDSSCGPSEGDRDTAAAESQKDHNMPKTGASMSLEEYLSS